MGVRCRYGGRSYVIGLDHVSLSLTVLMGLSLLKHKGWLSDGIGSRRLLFFNLPIVIKAPLDHAAMPFSDCWAGGGEKWGSDYGQQAEMRNPTHVM